MRVGQGVAAGHLDAAVLGLGKDISKGGAGCAEHNPGTVIDGAEGDVLGQIEIDFFGVILGSSVDSVADAVAHDEQIHSAGIFLGEGGVGDETVTAGQVLNDEVVVGLNIVGSLGILTGNQVRNTARAVGADDLNRLAGGESSCAGSQGKDHDQNQQHGENALQVFHLVPPNGKIYLTRQMP